MAGFEVRPEVPGEGALMRGGEGDGIGEGERGGTGLHDCQSAAGTGLP
jgi:hypothetical protein